MFSTLSPYDQRWCVITQMMRRYLDRAGIPYEYVDLDLDPEVESRLGWVTGGRVESPVVYVGGEVLVQAGRAPVQRSGQR